MQNKHYYNLPQWKESLGSAVGIVTGYGLDVRGVGDKEFSLLDNVQTSPGALPT
jgi:hypothetical protein